jgi:hypothetical protein
MADGGRSGLSLWGAGLLGFLAYRSGRRRAEQDAAGRVGRAGSGAGRDGADGRGRWPGGEDGGGPLRDIVLPDGRDAVQITAELFLREEGSTQRWRRVVVEGTGTAQAEIEATLREVAAGGGAGAGAGGSGAWEGGAALLPAEDVPMVLMPLGTRRRVNAVDVYGVGGRVGNLPEYAVGAVGDEIRTVHLANDRPCAVMSRISRGGTGALVVELLMPESFLT